MEILKNALDMIKNEHQKKIINMVFLIIIILLLFWYIGDCIKILLFLLQI